MRTDPPLVAAERDALEAWLDYHRETLAWKCEGLEPEQLCARPIPSTSLSLIGLVRHMTEVERSWFQRCMASRSIDEAPPLYYDRDANPDGDFDDVDPTTVDADVAAWRAEIAASDHVLAAVGLDVVLHHAVWDEDLDVRWVVIHMIEEYARHNGHADLLRQAIDGATGE